MFDNYEYKELKSYKGYDIQKAWKIDEDGISTYFYLVADDDDYIGEEYSSIKEAHRFIDSIA